MLHPRPPFVPAYIHKPKPLRGRPCARPRGHLPARPVRRADTEPLPERVQPVHGLSIRLGPVVQELAVPTPGRLHLHPHHHLLHAVAVALAAVHPRCPARAHREYIPARTSTRKAHAQRLRFNDRLLRAGATNEGEPRQCTARNRPSTRCPCPTRVSPYRADQRASSVATRRPSSPPWQHPP